jgi:uncharacterized membrane protein HdeD (DUF308 family)
MTTDPAVPARHASQARSARVVTRRWWLYLLTGVLWIVYAFIVLSASVDTVWAVTILFAVGFIAGGFVELAVASVAESWRWLHAVFGVLSVVAGIVALVWPGETFLILAAIVGWYLMFDGMVNLATAIITRDVNDAWWLGLVLGIAQILVGFWAVGYTGRSIALLIIWVAAAALARGISDIIAGLMLHGSDRELRNLIEPPALA